MKEHTVLVAFVVYADSMEQAQRKLMSRLPRPDVESGRCVLDSWWIAEDERYDGSDNDSAVFVPMGAQKFWSEYGMPTFAKSMPQESSDG